VKTAVALSLLLFGCAATAANPSGDEQGTSGDEVVTGINVQPYARIGTGNAGNGINDISTPDGVIFDARGSLLLTDADNHRMQVWDVRGDAPKRLGQFGDAHVFVGQIVDVAINPKDGKLIVSDEDSHLSYSFLPPKADEDPAAYKLETPDMFKTETVKKVGGVTFDSKGRLYTVDAHQNLVRRYDETGKPDPTFKFAELGGTAYLNGCEGIAVDEKRGLLYVSSEFTSAIQVFDLETGAPKNHAIGRKTDAAHPGQPTGQSVFASSIEGLWILDDYLLASDEADGGEGHVMIFDLASDSIFDHDATDYAQMKAANKPSAFIGGFGSFCSPDSVAAFTDPQSHESYVAVADQCHYQVAMYKWSEVTKAGKFGRHAP